MGFRHADINKSVIKYPFFVEILYFCSDTLVALTSWFFRVFFRPGDVMLKYLSHSGLFFKIGD